MKILTFAAIILALSLSLTLPASARGDCPCDPLEPEPRAPLHVWLPMVSDRGESVFYLYPPPLPDKEKKPVRPPTTYLPLVGGAG